MNTLQEAINNIMMYYVVFFAITVLAILISFCCKKRNKTYIFGIVLILFSISYFFTSVIPFIQDYMHNRITVTEGYYENVIGGADSSFSSSFGVYSVTLETEEKEIHLRTAPGNKEVFVLGRHYVRAYYLPKSKILLYIELQEGQKTGDGSVVPTEKTE